MSPTVYKKTLKCIGNNNWMSSPRVTFNLTCGKGVTELQNLANLPLSSFDVSPKYTQKCTENDLWHLPWRPHVCTLFQMIYALTSFREWSVPISGSPHTI